MNKGVKFYEKTFNGEIIKTYSDISFFEIPENTISGTARIEEKPSVTQNSNHLYWVEEDFELMLSPEFNEYQFEEETYYRLYLLPYNEKINKFDIDKAYITNYYGVNNVNVPINTERLIEGEYVVKLEFEHPINLEVFDKLNKRIITNTLSNYLPMNYDEKFDKYFILLYKPEEPMLDIIKTKKSVNSQFNFNTIAVNKNVRSYPLNVVNEKGLLITLNGSVLTEGKDMDYVISGGLITFNGDLKESDVVNYIFYGNKGNNTLKTENIVVDYILNGETGDEGNAKVYHNTDKNTFEIYVDENIKDGNTLMVTLGGLLLTKNVDYILSKTNKRRIILNGSLKVGEIINVVYDTGTNNSLILDNNGINISWRIERNVNEGDGFFTVEISDDKYFNTVLESELIEYVNDGKVYNTNLTLDYGYGTVLYYRVKNTKKYIAVDGSILEGNKVSVPVKFEIKTDISNNY